MAVITKTQLENVSLDAETFSAVGNGGPTAVITNRTGGSIDSVAKAIQSLKAFNPRGAWVTATAYALKDVVTVSGIAYAAVTAHTSAAAFATDLSAGNWVIYQGALVSEVEDLEAKLLSRSVSLKDYGAVGDGVTDDIASLEAANLANPNQTLLGEGLTYFITSNLPEGFSLTNGTVLDDRMVTLQDDYSVVSIGQHAGERNAYIPEQEPASGGRFFAHGNHNFYAGWGAARFNTEGRRNVVIGSRSGMGGDATTNPSTFYYCTLIGSHSGEKHTTAQSNVALGTQSLQETTSGSGNTCLGTTSGGRITVGFNNTYVGYLSGTANAVLANIDGGSYNVGLGYRAHYVNETGTNNVIIGADAAVSGTTMDNNVVIGRQALLASVADDSLVAIGNRVFVNANGLSTSVAIGAEAGQAYTSGSQITIGGYQAAYAATTASSVTAFGYRAALNVTTGTGNTAFGSNSGSGTTTGINNTCIGNGTSSTATASNSMALGNGATISADNEINLGNASIASLRCQVALTVLSDERDKRKIGNVPGRSFIDMLEPFLAEWDKREGENAPGSFASLGAQNVLISQEALGIDLGLVNASNSEKLEMTYERMMPVLVQGLKEAFAEIDNLKSAQRA